MAHIIRRPRAQVDLFELWSYLVINSGEKKAEAVLRKINQKFEVLARQPGMGKQRDDLRKGLRSFPVERYVIFYYPLEDGIEVARVLSSRRDIESIFEDEELGNK